MHVAAVLISIALAIAITTPATAQKCEKNHHQAEGWASEDAGSAKLRDYFCRPQGLRVTFYRLSEMHAGNWVMAAPGRAVLPVATPAKPVKNMVYKEIETLFSKFGTKNCWYGGTSVDAPKVFGDGTQSVKATKSEGIANYEPSSSEEWCITIPHPSHSSGAIYLKTPDEIILKTGRWPESFNNYYNCGGWSEGYESLSSLLYCTINWRYLAASEFDTIERETRAWLDTVEQELGELDSREREQIADYKRHFSFFRYLSKKGWPTDFLVIRLDNEECGSISQFRYFPRPLILDLVIIENISKKKVQVDDLLGSRSAEQQFRLPATSDVLRQQKPVRLGFKGLTLEPGAAIAVPLRIVFVDGTGQETDAQFGQGSPAPWGNAAEARKAFERLQSLPSGTMIEPSPDHFGPVINQKRRESFLPPKLPIVSKYVYGPEIAVTGMMVGGKAISFEGHSANYIRFTSQSAPAASCPVLYAWNDNKRGWINLGKVIEQAREAKNEATEVVTVEPFTSRFRLAEEEPEVSYIDKVQLNLHLRDGRRLSLSPRKPQLVEADGQYLRILAYTSVDIQFEMPTEISSSDIEKSALEITGYYRRYSSIFAAARARASSRVPSKVSDENSALAIPK